MPDRDDDRPTAVLVHGFPHTAAIWRELTAELGPEVQVVAPDLPWLRADAGTQDAASLASWLERTIQESTSGPVTVVALDAGVPPTVLLALRRPELFRHLVLLESTLGTLPGAEDFFSHGPPWWFGFHAVPGLAERVTRGNEDDYVGWFLDHGTRGRIPDAMRAEIGDAYARPGVLAQALEYYRALPQSGRQLAGAVRGARLVVPTTAVGAAPVGRALEGQLRPFADDLRGRLLQDCGHVVPVDRPDALLEIVEAAGIRGTS